MHWQIASYDIFLSPVCRTTNSATVSLRRHSRHFFSVTGLHKLDDTPFRILVFIGYSPPVHASTFPPPFICPNAFTNTVICGLFLHRVCTGFVFLLARVEVSLHLTYVSAHVCSLLLCLSHTSTAPSPPISVSSLFL